MKRLLLPAVLALAFSLGSPAASAGDGKLHVILTDSPEGKPAKEFDPNVAKIYAAWLGKDVIKAGDQVRAVWIAEDTGGAAPANHKIDELGGTVSKDGAAGSVSISKPTAGWPIGKYRVEVYVGDMLAATRHFTIGMPATAAEKHEDDD